MFPNDVDYSIRPRPRGMKNLALTVDVRVQITDRSSIVLISWERRRDSVVGISIDRESQVEI